VFPKQQEIAASLLDCVLKKIDLKSFKKLAFYILVPGLNSLYHQTLLRVKQFVNDYREAKKIDFFPDLEFQSHVFKATKGKRDNDTFECMKRRMEAEPDTLFLLIQDEAHYEATQGGAADEYINNGTVRSNGNVLTLLVSATPYNLLTTDSQIVPENEVKWLPENEGDNYYGMERYCEQTKRNEEEEETNGSFSPGPGCITKDTAFDSLATKNMKHHQDKKQLKDRRSYARADALLKGYTQALEAAEAADAGDANHGEWSTDLTARMMSELLLSSQEGQSGMMILLRTTNQEHGTMLWKGLTMQRDKLFKDRFAVILDIDSNKHGSVGLKGAIPAPLLEDLRQRQGVDSTKKVVVSCYSDLHEVPCILILVEKGKMGDTFPRSLRYYDLRLRYASSCEQRAAAEQDLGRGFRYRQSKTEEQHPLPMIIVGPACYRELMKARKDKDRVGLLRLNPDYPDKMKKKKSTELTLPPKHPEAEKQSEWPYPLDDFDTQAYRTNWDSGWCAFMNSVHASF
jgi:hypothetical protein